MVARTAAVRTTYFLSGAILYEGIDPYEKERDSQNDKLKMKVQQKENDRTKEMYDKKMEKRE
jgi:hypothetical protein